MPLSEVPQAASKARTQFRMRNFMPDNDFTELVYQNDQIVMQNHPDKIQEKDSNFFKMHNKFDRLRSVDSDIDELMHVLPGSAIGLNSQLEETSYPDAVLMNFSIGRENISIENGQKFDVSTNECRALVVSSSSFGSGSSSSDKLYDSEITKKAKNQDGEERSKQNDNAHADSVTSRKSGKRTRAAEVHNLSERRRRDRINEKMRALQELIPNCTKVDKATMLDEAIEYLKNLQLQVQMMYMNSGICVPHYSPMDIGMGYMYGMHPSQLLPPRPSMQFHRTLYSIRSEDAQTQMNDQAPNYTANGSST